MVDYLSLVARSGQVNTPPGSYNTIKEWIANSFLGRHSNVLEIGCSMGFITIEIARYVGATCCGLDLHEGSIKAATENVDPHVSGHVSFVCGNAGNLQFPNHDFSHVVIGGHLPFIPDEMRLAHIAEAVRVAKPWGYVLTALYFYKSSPPKTLVKEFNQAVGTNLEVDHDYAYWSGLFNCQRLTLEYESINEIIPANSARIETYLQQLSDDSRQEWENRLRLFNENGKYLNYFVRVYRRLPDQGKIMLQIPRGGIYQTKRISRQVF
jgi:ubiquinone/menaquinone biosynthesis C-methylase UbiE